MVCVLAGVCVGGGGCGSGTGTIVCCVLCANHTPCCAVPCYAVLCCHTPTHHHTHTLSGTLSE